MTWLVPKERRFETPDRYWFRYKPEKIQDIEAIIIHYTGSRKAKPTRNWLTRKDGSYVSAHFLIHRDGTVDQLASLDDRCFHAGGRTSKLFGKGNVNGRTIGIELMNVGPIIPRAGDSWMDTNGNLFKGAGISAGGKRPGRSDDYKYINWEAYPPEQLDALQDLLRKLIKEFPSVGEDLKNRLIGHEEVDPKRKMDPGPAFPWEIIRNGVACG